MLTFDYREIIEKSGRTADWYSDRLQADFDTINRMAALTEGISFADCYSGPMREIVPRMKGNLSRLDTGDRNQLFKYPGEVESLLGLLESEAGDSSFSDLAHSEEGQYSAQAGEALYVLNMRHGIHLPMPNNADTNDYLRSLRDLIDFAGTRYYRDIFQKSKAEFEDNERSAIYHARAAGILAD